MDNLIPDDVFDLTPLQFSDHLSSTARQAVQNAFNAGLYFSYPAGEKGTFVHEYSDGSKEIVRIDLETGKELIVKFRY